MIYIYQNKNNRLINKLLNYITFFNTENSKPFITKWFWSKVGQMVNFVNLESF